MGIYECTVNKTRLTISVFKISHQYQEACYVRDSSLKRMRVALGKNIEYAKSETVYVMRLVTYTILHCKE